jgi:signal transduction histidine kinase
MTCTDQQGVPRRPLVCDARNCRTSDRDSAGLNLGRPDRLSTARARIHRVKVSAYAAALGSVAVATIATFLLQPWMGSSTSLMFFPAVLLAAMNGGYGPALLATVLSALSLAYFFVPPRYSFNIGADDAIRLAVFMVVAIVTASVSAARKRAEDAQRRALDELHAALTTLRKVSGWPTFVDAGLAGGARRLLTHAAAVVGCRRASAAWESEDEPWLYVAESDAASATITRFAPTDEQTRASVDPRGATLACIGPRGEEADASAPFEVEHLSGRVFFIGLPSTGPEVTPLAEIVAREVGNSLEQLYIHDRVQQVAVREDRIRVARDLHDGVLQSLTAIRFQLQALADQPVGGLAVGDHLLAIERAIAIEQRELRRFIDDLKPSPRRSGEQGALARALEALRDRLGGEWQAPITVRVTPPDLGLRADIADGVRLMVREAAVNAFKHAHPSRVSIDVQEDDDRSLRVIVSNDGRGFPFRGRMEHDALVASDAAPVSLRERVEELGGTLSIDSTSTGSRVEIVIPASKIDV